MSGNEEVTVSIADENNSMVEETAPLDVDVVSSIFRAYDIRGVVDETLNEGVVELNYKMMQLYAPSISVQSKGKIDYVISNFEYDYDRETFQQMMVQDGFGQYSFENLFRACQEIVKENK